MTLKAGGSLNILHVLRAPVGGLFRFFGVRDMPVNSA
jgi:hypothetical protein